MMTPRTQLLAALADGPGTSYELALATGLPLKRACGTLYALFESKTIVRSPQPVRLRPRSPGAYVYALPTQLGSVPWLPSTLSIRCNTNAPGRNNNQRRDAN